MRLKPGEEYLKEDERLLIARAAQGDNSAFSRLFYEYKDMVYRVVYRLLGNTEETGDAVQQTFIELFKSLPGYEGKSKFSTWLYRIAVNVSIQYFRKHRIQHRDQDHYIDPETMASTPSVTDPSMERKELRRKIEEALASINIRKRTVVVLHDIENRTMEEISEIINVPVGTIKSRLFYGRDELKKKLEKLLET
ncbi:MAG: sigma-70 family RNA polymerase sigma factor [Chitinispirillaceae bacterium]|nr:sigma-70 family RNA polymerase sigma factor [Chitinispirillaceae bacterium]